MTITLPRHANLPFTALAGALALAAAMGFGRFSFTPILPGMMTDLHLMPGDAGLIAAANFLGYLLGAVLAGQGWAAGRERLIALSSLLATSLLLAAMALTEHVGMFMLIRFLSGAASAFAMIFTSSIVLAHVSAHASIHAGEYAQSTHFGGVGLGIAASSLMVYALPHLFGASVSAGWRLDWLAGAGLTFVVFLVVSLLLPRVRKTEVRAEQEPPLFWGRPFLLLFASYGLFGFGYVVTATFIVTMARMANAGPVAEFLAWFLAGIMAAASLFVWRPVLDRVGLAGAYSLALLLAAIGVFASVGLPGMAAPLVGAALLGLTFMTITAYGLRLARTLAPASPRKALSIMTAAFGVGQTIGPLVAGWLAAISGSFALPSLVAGAVLLVSLILAASLWRKTV
ncbi:YbfB/YjiJ family MFS transporter [Agrobacterium vitis]|uniref:YbfB/YjiJ family MFS transporter n=1 Tax=Agrobacterium vitis TaxID=373 RepID=A0AAE4WA63_AGRVI|nr:YbfB/YjiJ family MFS transporter [Agrobacterium vitis]MCF1498428.1 YbfB/YjiJ family MFS transporter [Allorhizobium sp. Av2]MCM2438454.1 YbfB/YjiJ family MFS transporter [Agrobacterium vitis]MUZ56164.1 YbfB/YjiJ family MFS transporter [Agrobacterium vitis]MVA64699.1 YbfB/YjiJ family MFS transporter [Agrobacterium vitis]MVA85670.1 YbfB/YjiJ family MFS transporter [Agrobacterium vitis]